MRIPIQVLVTTALLFFVLGFAPARPEVPDSLRAPAGEDVILSAHATGVQIYVCQAETEQKSAWVLKAPEAEMTDSAGKTIVHHSAGPAWKHVDGSEVTGKVVAKQDAPKPGAIPWLLLSAATHTGEGILARVTTIQRIHTEGGLPPNASDCNVSANGKDSRSTYSADYYFYAVAKK
ncbi:MAG TPA: DUF3455 domain-containing protein [Terriglobales bacterium]|nr:DUF3455 domain-containing protein [Terriglobales bacterium]